MKKVAVGLSGGVDSAVAALLLKQQGYEVVGVHLYCWPPKSVIEKDKMSREEWIKKNGCRADEDRKSALNVALELGIPFQTLDLSEEYNRRVVDYFYREYEAGRTPNPDVLCNSEIKFGLFLEWALQNGFDYVATGHYAKVNSSKSALAHNSASATDNPSAPAADGYLDTRPEFSASRNPSNSGLRNVASRTDEPRGLLLSIPKDEHKDQTYFLWKLTQKELAHVLFPLGDYTKPEVREIAKKDGLKEAGRPDSQGICFIGEVDVREFLKRRLEEKPGKVIDTKGEQIGVHRGVWFYTIGQRGGWQLTPKAQKMFMENGETPIFYVISKDAEKNRLVVGFGAETYKDSFVLADENWINETPAGEVMVRIRHTGKLIDAEIIEENGVRKVELSEPQRGVASGQSAVFYRNGICLGGGIIG